METAKLKIHINKYRRRPSGAGQEPGTQHQGEEKTVLEVKAVERKITKDSSTLKDPQSGADASPENGQQKKSEQQ